jgi:hypothetical protein
MTKAELEQRLTDAQSECIEWVLRHDAVELANRELKLTVAHLRVALNNAVDAEWTVREALQYAEDQIAYGGQDSPAWYPIAAFIAGIALASLVEGVW